MRRVGTVLAATMIGASALGGCGGSDSPGATDSSQAAAREKFSVEAALRTLPPVKPSADQPIQVFAGDLAKAAALGDLPKPVDKRSTSAWFNGLRKSPLDVSGGEGLGLESVQTGAMRKVLGFDARDVKTVASVESQPDTVTVLRLKGGATLKKGVTTSGSGQVGNLDPADVVDAPFPFIYGVVQQRDQIALAKSSKLLSAWGKRGRHSLADQDAFLEVAKALDVNDIYDATLSDRPSEAPPISQETHDQMHESMPAFDAAGIAQGVEDGKAVEYIAYLVDDADQAKDKIADVWENGISVRLGKPFDQLLDVDGITAKGNVVTVKIFPKSEPGLATIMILAGDTPFFVFG